MRVWLWAVVCLSGTFEPRGHNLNLHLPSFADSSALAGEGSLGLGWHGLDAAVARPSFTAALGLALRDLKRERRAQIR